MKLIEQIIKYKLFSAHFEAWYIVISRDRLNTTDYSRPTILIKKKGEGARMKDISGHSTSLLLVEFAQVK